MSAAGPGGGGLIGFAVLNIDRLHLRDENFVFICLFPIAKTMHAL